MHSCCVWAVYDGMCVRVLLELRGSRWGVVWELSRRGFSSELCTLEGVAAVDPSERPTRPVNNLSFGNGVRIQYDPRTSPMCMGCEDEVA